MPALLAIDDIKPGDGPAWRKLWDANNRGHINEAVAAQTWSRLIDPAFPVKGFVARDGESGDLAGLVHYVLHPVTGALAPACYMQDLYVDPACRQRGLAKALVARVAEQGRREGWTRLYWLAEGKNEAAQSLYRTVGVKLDFTFHMMPLNI
jgi:ribosomal protein S18 acetylase RimI-like enzyme